MEAYNVMRYQGSQMFKTIGSRMAATLSALGTGRTLIPRNIIYLFLVLISVTG
jgi:hypothetical protein